MRRCLTTLHPTIATRKSTLVFCANLAHVRDLTNTFRAAGLDARYLHSGTPVAERKGLLHAFKCNDFPILVNCGKRHVYVRTASSKQSLAILTEGADIPNIDCVVVARPTRSRNVFAQMVQLIVVGLFTVTLAYPADWSRNETLSEHWQDRLSDH
jgi:superfamily II DNA or RNA helicase